MLSPNEWLDLVVSRASELRSVGVLSIGADGCSATLAAYEKPVETDKSDTQTTADEPVDALHHPASYPDGIVPGFEIHKYEIEE